MLKETALSLQSADKQVDPSERMRIRRSRPDYRIKLYQISEVIVVARLECKVQQETVQKDNVMTP